MVPSSSSARSRSVWIRVQAARTTSLARTWDRSLSTIACNQNWTSSDGSHATVSFASGGLDPSRKRSCTGFRSFSSRGSDNRNSNRRFELHALPFSVSPEEALQSFRKWAEDEQGLRYLMSYQSVRIGAAYVPVWSFDVNIRFSHGDNWKPEMFRVYDHVGVGGGNKPQNVIFVPGLSTYSGFSYRRSLINPVHSTTLVFMGDRTEPFGGWMLKDMILKQSGNLISVVPDAWTSTHGHAFSVLKEDLQDMVNYEFHGNDPPPKVQTELVSSRRVFLPTFVIDYKILGLEYRAFVSGCDPNAPVGGVSHQLFGNNNLFNDPVFHQSSRNFLTQVTTSATQLLRRFNLPVLVWIFRPFVTAFWFVLLRLWAAFPVIGAAGGIFAGFRKIVQPWMDNRRATAEWERQREHESKMTDDKDVRGMNDFEDLSGSAQKYFYQHKAQILRSLSGEFDHQEGDYDWYSDWQAWARQQWEKQARQQQQQQQQAYQQTYQQQYQQQAQRQQQAKPKEEYKWPFNPDDPYAVLGINRNATDKEVSDAFRKEMLKYHPDTQPNASEAQKRRYTERSKLVSEAYRKIKTSRKASSGGATGRRNFSSFAAAAKFDVSKYNPMWLKRYQQQYSGTANSKASDDSTNGYGENDIREPSVEDYSAMSADDLKAIVIKAIRTQQHPRQGQAAVSELEKLDENVGNLSSIQTSLIDYWMKFQSSLLEQVKLSRSSGESDSMAEEKKLELLSEAYEAAIAVTNTLDAMDNPSNHHYEAILRAWAITCEMAHEMGLNQKDIVVGIPQRTQSILNQQPNPSNESYNQVIRAWAYSSEYLRGTMAEQIFQKIDYPDGNSFRMIIRAHSLSRETRSAFQATGHFMRMMRLLEMGKEDMQPTSMEDYHTLCKAWEFARDRNAPSKVVTVLNIMNMVYRQQLTELRPDTNCYRSALLTMSKKHTVDDVGELVDDILREMRENNIHPDTECYRAAIIAWKNMALAKDNPNAEGCITRTQQLLKEMTEEFHRTTIITVQPTTDDYNHVLEALSLSKDTRAPAHAEKLLYALKATSSLSGGPNPATYRYVLLTWSNSKSQEKLSRTSKLLEELVHECRVHSEWLEDSTARKSLVDAFTAFIRVCGLAGSTNHHDYFDRTQTMTIALRCVEDMKHMGLTPDSGTYAALIEACDHLLPRDGRDRQDIMERIFRRACDEGYVDANLLAQFRSTAPAYLFTKLVVANSILVEDVKAVPQSWTRNVPGYKEGKKNIPLSIQGTYKFTKAAAEYRARKLRHRTNQRILQGGRLN
ncbi:chaperone protein DnaJ [Nitzschia inconspicua]|uniref:Chaperone protein DnaJ n=1 Tax=Nitzschia inconspicua TaxID=303405 RepID=A0A9K3PL68_9STRA|nr:chaperone protein DnaJ [Nitzschia inconspicua]